MMLPVSIQHQSAMLFAMLMASTAVGAQTGSVSALDEIIVSASRTPSAARELPTSLTVVQGEALAQQLRMSPNIQDVLGQTVPGLTLSPENGGFSSGSGTGPLLRGRPASVLINGVPVNTLLRGNGFDLNLVDTFAIDRIEVLRGASAQFGFGAPGGIISLSTRQGRTEDLEVILRGQLSANTREIGDTLGYRLYAGAGQKTAGGLDYFIGIGLAKLPERVTPRGLPTTGADETNINVDANVGYAFANESELRARFNLIHRDIHDTFSSPTFFLPYVIDGEAVSIDGAPGIDTRGAIADPAEEASNDFQTNFLTSISYMHPDILGSQLDVTLYYQRNERLTVGTSAFELLENKLVNTKVGLRTSLTTKVSISDPDDLHLTYGLDLIRDEMFRDFRTFGGDLTRTVDVPRFGPYTYSFGSPARPLSPPIRLDAYAGFLQGRYAIGPVVLRAGVRHEEFRPRSLGYDQDGFVYPEGDMLSFNSTLFNAGAVVDVAQGLQMYGGMSQGTEITELGRVLRTQGRTPEGLAQISGNPARTTEYEIGFRGSRGALNFTIAGFYSDAPLSSQVRTDPDNPIGPLIPIREPQKTRGVEATFNVRPTANWEFGGLFSYIEGERRCDPDVEGAPCTEFEPQPSTRISPAVITLYAGYTIGDRASVRLQGTQIFDRDPFETDGGRDSFDELGAVKGYFLADLLVDVKLGQGMLSLGIDNLFDQKYVPADRQAGNGSDFNLEGEGRRVSLTYGIDF